VPTVVQPIGSMVERVRDAETGFIAGDDAAFALAARDLLTDDVLWNAQHDRAPMDKRSTIIASSPIFMPPNPFTSKIN